MCEGFFTADMTYGEVRRTFRKLLAESTNPFVRQTPALDADVIICHFAGISRTRLLTHEDELITFFLAEDLSLALEKRLSGLPVAYITNEKEFYGRPFYVDQNVLIPKPDTELLVELAVAAARRRMSEMRLEPSPPVELSESVRPSEQTALSESSGEALPASLRMADICTGSGCIAISLLLELAGSGGALKANSGLSGAASAGSACSIEITATDISSDALRVAGKNIEKLVPDALRAQISLLEGDLCAPLDEAAAGALKADDGLICEPSAEKQTAALFDIIVSNPPYVPAAVTDELLSDGRGEPRLALDGGDDGLAIIRRLGPQVFSHLVPGGSFFLETGEYNAETAAAYLETCGFTDVCIHRDLSGQLRVTEAHRPL